MIAALLLIALGFVLGVAATVVVEFAALVWWACFAKL